jgi:peptidoglycan/xylan/chitin deacetylase (PgdA/CDA1 family)
VSIACMVTNESLHSRINRVRARSMKAGKPLASLSLDLDNKWSYLKTHGDPGWERFPSYLDTLVPRVLDFLKARDLTVTFFIIGQDAALQKNHEILRSIAKAGHEIGNHSFHHEPWMHLYSRQQVETEIAVAEEHIERATWRKPSGFRGPGYSLSPAMLEELVRRGYRYDASTLPNILAPLARAYYFRTAEFTLDQRRQRRALGGTLRDSLRPIKPYRWQLDEYGIIEIPVTTMPIFRIPIHLSYLMCLRVVLSQALALRYFNAALRMCRLTGVLPSFLLHPTDFLGCDDTQDLSFLPGMTLPRDRKLELVSEVIRRLTEDYRVVTLQHHAQEAAERPDLPMVEPCFPTP